MDPSAFFGLFVLAIMFAIFGRVLAGSFDGERVEAYIRDMGGELIDRSWDPFGPGWFGEKDSRIYEVVYRDREGRIHRAHVKTSMLSGVYLTNDRIVEEPTISAEDEKARLTARLQELESLSDQQHKLRELDAWKEQGLISVAEYEARRQQIVRQA